MKKYGFTALLMGFMLIMVPSIINTNKVQGQAVFDGFKTNISSSNTVKVEFNIYVNDNLNEKDDFQFELINKKHNVHTKLKMSNSFTAFLDYNQEYTFKVGHKDYNVKVIDIFTRAPENQSWTILCNIYLYNNESDGYIGKIAYDSKMKNFKYVKT